MIISIPSFLQEEFMLAKANDLQQLPHEISSRKLTGEDSRTIIEALMHVGWSREFATCITLQVALSPYESTFTYKLIPQDSYGTDDDNSSAGSFIGQGLIYLAAGLVVFGGTFSCANSSPEGGLFIIPKGAIVLGALLFLRGIWGLLVGAWRHLRR